MMFKNTTHSKDITTCKWQWEAVAIYGTSCQKCILHAINGKILQRFSNSRYWMTNRDFPREFDRNHYSYYGSHVSAQPDKYKTISRGWDIVIRHLIAWENIVTSPWVGAVHIMCYTGNRQLLWMWYISPHLEWQTKPFDPVLWSLYVDVTQSHNDLKAYLVAVRW